MLTACSVGREGNLPQSGNAANVPTAFDRPLRAGSGDVYVANWYDSNVTVYSAGGGSKLRTITDGIAYPNAIAIDKTGSVFVGNYGTPSGSLTSSISVYGLAGRQPNRTITQGIVGPYAIAFYSGKVYVVNNGGPTVTIYDRNSNAVLQTIDHQVGSPEAVAFDSLGYLYVANWLYNSVTIYRPGMPGPFKPGPYEKIKVGIARPDALAFDAADNLYVANFAGRSVTVYRPNHKDKPRTITKGIAQPVSLISTTGKELYVLNRQNNTVSFYSESTLGLIGTISAGIACPSTMAMSSTGLLYVANTCPSSVTVYSLSSTKLIRTITNGLDGPVAIGVAP
jgi:DNA-binding beta-propeller fold protein YncE